MPISIAAPQERGVENASGFAKSQECMTRAQLLHNEVNQCVVDDDARPWLWQCLEGHSDGSISSKIRTFSKGRIIPRTSSMGPFRRSLGDALCQQAGRTLCMLSSAADFWRNHLSAANFRRRRHAQWGNKGLTDWNMTRRRKARRSYR